MHILIQGVSSATEAFRIVLGSFDRQTFKSPFVVHFGESDVAVANFAGFKLAYDRRDGGVAPLLSAGNYEPHITQFFQVHIRPGMRIVDIRCKHWVLRNVICHFGRLTGPNIRI